MKIVKKIPRDFFETKEFEEIDVVKKIINDVKKNGDKALRRYTLEFDKIKLGRIKLTKKEIIQAYKKVDKRTIAALKNAIKRIKGFALLQKVQFKDFEYNGLGQKVVAIDKVGVYVPGGNYPLPSSALMGIIPARVAGVNQIIVCSPKIKPVTIVAADIAGADMIFNVGGVQAIAGMAYGTKSIPKVDKIVGPGNKYVMAAKKEVYGIVGIDFLAGPSEMMIIADQSGNAKFIAADLLAQAEHDVNALPVLVTTSLRLAKKVNCEVKKQLVRLKTNKIARAALNNGVIILVENIDKAIEIANKKAPEHLELQVKNPKQIMNKLRNYGSLFLGRYSAEVFGDYCSGTNHILPTNGAARYTSGLNVKDFVKLQTYQSLDRKSARKLGKTTTRLAEIEGLDGHRKAAQLRLE